MRLYYTLLRSLSVSAEVGKEIMKMKTIEDIMAKIQPICKNEKDIKVMKYFLVYFTGFLSAYASTEEGQKAILV
jgi:hypothetical protein